MPSPDAVFAGIDPSSTHKAFSYALLDNELRLIALSEAEFDEIAAVFEPRPPVVAAISSPSGPNRGVVREKLTSTARAGRHLRGAEVRLAEYELRLAGVSIAATPGRVDMFPTWMRQGLQIYAEFGRQGYGAGLPGSAPRHVIETHPEACFHMLLGKQPLPRPTLEGRLQRQLVLSEVGLNVRDPMNFFEEITRRKLMLGVLPFETIHTAEELDTLAAAYVAWLTLNHPEAVTRFGSPDEGEITLPVGALAATG